jgi:hypothetical protein
MENRIFTTAELEEMGTPTTDLILMAIETGDLEKAKKLTRRMQKETFVRHEAYRDWIIELLSLVGRRLGNEALEEHLREHSHYFVELQGQYEKKDVRRQVEMLTAGLRSHMSPLILKEDDEKISIGGNPCGSGGRAIQQGSYKPPKNFLTVKGTGALTFGKEELPVYCCHCSFLDILPTEATGYPIWVTETPEEPGVTTCWVHLYKDKSKIPARYWERFALKKPQE